MQHSRAGMRLVVPLLCTVSFPANVGCCALSASAQRACSGAAAQSHPGMAGCCAMPAVQVMGVQTDNYVRQGQQGQQPSCSWHGEPRRLQLPGLLVAPHCRCRTLGCRLHATACSLVHAREAGGVRCSIACRPIGEPLLRLVHSCWRCRRRHHLGGHAVRHVGRVCGGAPVAQSREGRTGQRPQRRPPGCTRQRQLGRRAGARGAAAATCAPACSRNCGCRGCGCTALQAAAGGLTSPWDPCQWWTPLSPLGHRQLMTPLTSLFLPSPLSPHPFSNKTIHTLSLPC